jgi:dTDP-4-dehydrorhamnose 3,5-epimerase
VALVGGEWRVKFLETDLRDAYVIELEPATDERGFFARSFCEEEFAAHGLPARFAQCNVSFNHKAGTTRGMHWQVAEHGEAKLVRCTGGAIFDVIVDLRRDSPSRNRYTSVELSAANHLMLFVPEGFAHGFQTLGDDTEVFYQMSTPFVPDAARGFRWDDPDVGIPWPAQPTVMSERDRALPRLVELE